MLSWVLLVFLANHPPGLLPAWHNAICVPWSGFRPARRIRAPSPGRRRRITTASGLPGRYHFSVSRTDAPPTPHPAGSADGHSVSRAMVLRDNLSRGTFSQAPDSASRLRPGRPLAQAAPPLGHCRARNTPLARLLPSVHVGVQAAVPWRPNQSKTVFIESSGQQN